MRKKIMMVAVLLGALSLGACVDDNESQSVTNVREAKAEQLKSIAAMNNAEAEAKLIYANAEAQLKAAEAALKQAQADKQAAEAEALELENRLAEAAYDAELAARLAEAQARQRKAEAEIEKINGELKAYQMDLEKRIAELQVALLQAQKDLTDKEDAIAQAEMDRLEKLATRYSTLLYSYTEETQALATLKSEKMSIEAGLEDWKVAKEEAIAENNVQIGLIDQQIELYKQYTNYTEDVDALKDQVTLKSAERNQANDKANALYKDYAEKENSFANDTKLAGMLAAINENDFIKMLSGYNSDYIYWGRTYINFADYSPVANFNREYAEIEKEGYDNSYFYTTYKVEIKAQDLRQLELTVNNEISTQDVKGKEEAINKAETGTKALLDAAKKATETAKKAWDAKPEDDALKAAYQNALYAEQIAQSNYDNSVQNLEDAKANVEKLNTLYALVSSSTADLEKAVADYNAAAQEAAAPVAEAMFAWLDGQETVNGLDAEIAAMNAVLYGRGEEQMTLYDYLIGQLGSVDYAYVQSQGNLYDISSILFNSFITVNDGQLDGAVSIQTLIDALEDTKAELLAENEDYSESTSMERTIELKQAQIDGKDAVVKVIEIKMNEAKAALDAALAEYDEEETPAA